MRPILHQHQLQAGQKLQTDQFAYPPAKLETSVYKDIVVSGFDEPDVLSPVQHGLVGDRSEDTASACVWVICEGSFYYLGPNAIHFFVQGLQPRSKLCKLGLFCGFISGTGDAIDQTHIV